tara:strand:+ start:433 stop:732 length:300 start_codon:yes stop_codon:yes gene_type:complete
LTIASGEYIKDMRHMEYMKMKKEQEDNMDMVNSPAHYNASGIECIDGLEAMLGDGFKSYLQGNIAKYIWRYKYKNGVQDLKKAQWYLNKLIEVYDDDKS